MSFMFLKVWFCSRWAICAALILAVASCGGQSCTGCDCMAPIPGGFPSAKRIENGIQVRLSSSGIQFFEDNIADIVGT